MVVTFKLNGKKTEAIIEADTTLYQLLRKLGCYSVKCGCETTNCGLCTVIMNNKSVLSCAVLAAEAEGATIETLEGLESEALEFGLCLADEGAEQCGFCNTGFIVNVVMMMRELDNITKESVKEYLAGNLCRCTGYQGQLRVLEKFIERKRGVRI